MKVLDLFCGGGGAARGYANAGYEVVGVDNAFRDNFPYSFMYGDWRECLAVALQAYDISLIHASPPCQAYSALGALHRDREYPDLIGDVREALIASGKQYVIENVPGAPLRDPIRMCGSSFGLGVDCADGEWRQLRRHRMFECSFEVPEYRCRHKGRAIGVYGGGPGGGPTTTTGSLRAYQGTKPEKMAALGIDWNMTRVELNQAIPPAYTEHIAKFAPRGA